MSRDGIYHSACQVGERGGDSGSGGVIHFHWIGFFNGFIIDFPMQGTRLQRKIQNSASVERKK